MIPVHVVASLNLFQLRLGTVLELLPEHYKIRLTCINFDTDKPSQTISIVMASCTSTCPSQCAMFPIQAFSPWPMLVAPWRPFAHSPFPHEPTSGQASPGVLRCKERATFSQPWRKNDGNYWMFAITLSLSSTPPFFKSCLREQTRKRAPEQNACCVST